MILPIYTYGQPVLRKPTQDITPQYPDLDSLIENMFQTMAHADGVGLAAPQIGLPIRLFVIDAAPVADTFPDVPTTKQAYINPQIIHTSPETVTYEEGCLSLPGIHEKVTRPETITIQYQDKDFSTHTETHTGFYARIIQHEYDHLEGHVFTDHITPLRRQLISGKLNNITKGKAHASYKIQRNK